MQTIHPELLRGFHAGQYDALLLTFPLNVCGNTHEHFMAHKDTYDRALEEEFLASLHHGVADPYLIGYAAGCDAMVLEAEGLLGIRFGEDI